MPNYASSVEQRFFENLGQKLGRPIPEQAPVREVVGPPDFWAKMDQEDLLHKFIENAEKLTAKTHVITDKSQIPSKIREWTAEITAKTVICWDSPDLKQAGIMDACQAAGLTLTLWDQNSQRQEMLRKCASVDVGITWVDYGIANTGSMAIISSPIKSRSVSLLPPVHIAIIRKESILPHMGDIFGKLDERNLPSSLNFITGPSRTSDIEMDLALGVHGPGKVFILILEHNV